VDEACAQIILENSRRRGGRLQVDDRLIGHPSTDLPRRCVTDRREMSVQPSARTSSVAFDSSFCILWTPAGDPIAFGADRLDCLIDPGAPPVVTMSGIGSPRRTRLRKCFSESS